MVTVTPAEILARFNTRMRDTADRTFTSSEKDEFYASALDDQYTSTVTRDTSLSTVANQASYNLPTGFTDNVTEFGYDVNGDGFPYFLDRTSFDVMGGVLTLDREHRGLPSGKTIHLIGMKKLTASDSVPDYLVPYIIELMSIEAFETLKSGLTTRFLKNDITMSEIIASLNTHRQRAAELRSTLQNKRSVQG